MPHAISWSATKKKIDAINAKTKTIIVEIKVSRRDGHVTFDVSVRTCWRKVNGLVVLDAICRSFFLSGSARSIQRTVPIYLEQSCKRTRAR